MTLRLRLALPALLCCTLFPAAATAEWFPLETGTERHFEDPSNGDRTTSRITATETVRNREVFRMENVQEITGEDPHSYWNFWSVNATGELLLHGIVFSAGKPNATGIAYEPPIVFAAPDPGSSWTSQYDRLDLESGDYIGSDTLHGNNYGTEQVSLDLGTFDALITGYSHEPVEPSASLAGFAGERYSVTGSRLTGGATRTIAEDVISWWVAGIGEVQAAYGSPGNVTFTITFASVPIEDGADGTSQLKASFLPRK